MSMPEIPRPDPDMSQEKALTMILSSIALEEVALSHIINAEGEKIQYILKQTACHCGADIKDILAVNKSVTDILEMILQNQMILKSKMEKVLEHLPKPPRPPEPPLPPPAPCPPKQPHCYSAKCHLLKPPVCFSAVPGSYGPGDALQWEQQGCGEYFSASSECCHKIEALGLGRFCVDFCLQMHSRMNAPIEIVLQIGSGDKNVLEKRILLDWHMDECCWHKRAVVELPCVCCPCCISVFVCTPCEIELKQGRILLSGC